MITASKLAGFCAAHAIWCVSDGETLIPMLAYTTEEDERKMERLVIYNDLEASVRYGKEKLESNEMDANDAVEVLTGTSFKCSGVQSMSLPYPTFSP